MRRNIVKEKLRAGQVSFGTWITLGNLHATRLLARSGFDWLTLDLEHAAIGLVRSSQLVGGHCRRWLRAAGPCAGRFGPLHQTGGWTPVPLASWYRWSKMPPRAAAAVAAAKYPPEGVRSAGGGMHALNFGAPLWRNTTAGQTRKSWWCCRSKIRPG